MLQLACAHCGAETRKYASQVRSNTYCGTSCASKARGEARSLAAAAKYSGATRQCSTCFQVLARELFHANAARAGGTANQCKTCTRARKRVSDKRRATDNIAFYFARLLRMTKYQCPRRKIQFALTADDLLVLWERQGGECALTGKRMTHIHGQGKVATNASLDRIDSTGDYAPNNVQLVCYLANLMKNSFTVDELVDWAGAIVRRAERAGDAKDTRLAA